MYVFQGNVNENNQLGISLLEDWRRILCDCLMYNVQAQQTIKMDSLQVSIKLKSSKVNSTVLYTKCCTWKVQTSYM